MRRVRDAKRDVAIHAPRAGTLYHPAEQGWTGGAELQSQYIARALAERGLRVAHIVFEHPELPPSHDGVELVPQSKRARGPRGTREFLATWQALARADASVYIQRSAGIATGIVGAFARSRRRRFVYSVSSSVDLQRGPLSRTEAAVKDAGLRLANHVVTQTSDQQTLAERRLGSKVSLIRSFCEPVSMSVSPESFLWVGALADYKDPLAYLELAARVPEAKFVMVASPRHGSERLAAAVHERAASLTNVCLASPRPRDELPMLYAKAVALVNTSAFEGFPNTFMQAWAVGAPVLSLNVDPDRVIQRHGLGTVANGSVEQLAALAREYWAARSALSQAAAARQYVKREHDPAVVGDAWMELVSALLRTIGS